MNVNSLSSLTSGLGNSQVELAMMKKVTDQMQAQGLQLVQMIQSSPSPERGRFIDVRV